MAYRDLYKSIAGDVPRLSEPKAKQIVNDSLRQIYDHYLWHFLLEQSYLIIPNQLTTGLIGVTRGSADVVADATAKAALDTFGLLPPITECQLRVGAGQLYEIIAYDSTTATITLNQPYLEATNISSAYAIYRAYITPPLTDEEDDFVRFKFIHNRLPGYRPVNATSQSYLNKVDPTRASKSEALCYAPLRSKRLTTGRTVPVYELWPHPTTQRNLYTICQRRGKLLVEDEDEQPQPITDELIRTLSRYKAYEWADSHKGEFKELMAVNWSRKRSEIMDLRSMDSYPQQLGRAIKQDREIFMSSMLSNYYLEIYGTMYPGGNWQMNHAVAGGYATL